MRRLIVSCCLIVAVCLIRADLPGERILGQKSGLRGLGSVFDLAAGSVRDTNGDGWADMVAARVIVPAVPANEDVQTATNIAGRLGFETTALTLPVVLRANEVTQPGSVALPIIVGRGNAFVKPLIDKGVVNISALKPGQGLIAAVESPLGGGDGVVVVGGDDEGTLAAGTVLAAYLPRLWGSSGARIAQVETQATRYLKTRGIVATSRGVSSILVDSDRRGLAKLTVRVEVPAADVARTVTALESLDLAHRRGLDPEALNFANTAATDVEVWAGGKKAASATVRRSGPNSRTLTPPDDQGGRGGRGGRGAAAAAPAAPAAGRGTGEAGEVPAVAVTAETSQAAAPALADAISGEGEGGGRGGGAAPIQPKTFDLANAYSIEGWFGDTYQDLIPDRLETAIIVGDPAESLGAAHIATRLGLESTGVTLPLARDARKVTNAAGEPNPILIGRSNDLVQQLVRLGKVWLDDLKPGEGAIQMVPKAFGQATATVVAGVDPAGTDAAALYLARRVPYLWDVARGSFDLDDLTIQVGDFLAAKSGGAQASLALREVGDVLKTLDGKTIESFEAKAYLKEANPAFDKFLAGRIKDGLKNTGAVTVSSQGITDPVPVFEDKIDIPWEVDEFWAKFRSDVLPKVKAGSTVELETRLSESPEVRKGIADQVRAELTKAGATTQRVRVLSAYKQGFLWLTEVVVPELKGKSIKAINIKIATNPSDLTKKWRFFEVPTRWLHELYPVDELFDRQLGIPKSAFGMEMVDDAKDIYSVEATGAGGQVVYRGTFSPKFVEREYTDKFPGTSRVKVTTGWISASVNGQSAVDVRIATDPERFWDIYQGQTLTKIYDHVMRTTANRPTADKQPFFRDLDIEVWMSEPDFRIGVDEEQISALESLHEDLYFGTLAFFTALGRATNISGLNAPGKILPIIHPDRAGKPGQVRILYAGNASPRARIDISYKEKGVERPTRVTRDLAKIDTTSPIVVRAIVGQDRVREIELRTDPKDDREGLRAADALDELNTLHAAGLYKTQLSYDHIDRLAVSLAGRDVRSRRVIANTGAAPPSNVRTALAKPTTPLVKWDHIISPEESEAIVQQLAWYPEVKAYKVGHSYRGRDISMLEITQPVTSELISVMKYTAYKPTIIVTSRQHANEVSSTSHTLKLAELLVTDPIYKSMLKQINFILHPVTNPDGAALHFDLQKLTPHHMLHAGRYSALGQDVGGGGGAGSLLPESLVRPKMWRTWLPDISLNPHGYPSHEWVQTFAGYVSPQFRSYLSTRGWYTSMGGARDPRFPDLADAKDSLRDAVAREMNSNPDVHNMNVAHQARYRRWAYGFSPFLFDQEIYQDTAIYSTDRETGEPRGGRRVATPRPGQTTGGAAQWPQVTWASAGTEAPDETAQGEWLNLVTKAGFSFLMAHVKYLRDGEYHVERIEETAPRDGVSLTMLRVRPVKPGHAPATPSKAASAPGGKQ